jgi:hypothetical protein
MLTLNDIKSIAKSTKTKGYNIEFFDGRIINLHKRRCIPALLTLIKYGEGCESDLTRSTENIQELKATLGDKIDSKIIQDSYGDANKPYSELWTEEGFNFITNPPNQTRNGSKKYVLDSNDHDKLFEENKKAERKPPNAEVKVQVIKKQNGKCNFCGTNVKSTKDIDAKTYAKDRVRLVWDHRTPVEKGGTSDNDNYQALCFMCNKHKWQICVLCADSSKCATCALAFPEKNKTIMPTNEDISDRLPVHYRSL